MSPGLSNIWPVDEVEAATLSGVLALPSSNMKNERATYDFIFGTKTTGTIKTIVIDFPSSFKIDLTKIIERSGIGSGSLSVQGQSLVYTVSSPVSVPSGTTIRLELARIIATASGNSFTVNVRTLNTVGGTIDGPTASGTFTIKSLTGDDVSTGFMIRKTLKDDTVGNNLGWDPDGAKTSFNIQDSAAVGPEDNILVQPVVMGTTTVCGGQSNGAGTFQVNCVVAPTDGAELNYIITLLPGHVVVSSSSLSTPLSSSTTSPHISYQDETSSEFP
jgi:hypothetical protein